MGYYLPVVKLRLDSHIDSEDVIAVFKGGGSQMYRTYYTMLTVAD